MKLSSRSMIFLFGFLNGGAVVYLLLGWGFVPKPVQGYDTIQVMSAAISLVLCGVGWGLLFAKGPRLRDAEMHHRQAHK
ncbi:MAG: hypothetical protein ACPGO3_14760 [Magnetospiraceae bacterium]